MDKTRSQVFSKILMLLFIVMSLSVIPVYAEEDDDEESEMQKRLDILEYGLESEISDLITQHASQYGVSG